MIDECKRCHRPFGDHEVFHDEPTSEQLVGRVMAEFDFSTRGVYCPTEPPEPLT